MITPIEIRQQGFKKRFRGFDPEEVQAFLQGLSQEWENLREEYRATKEELERTKANYHALKEVEDMLHKTLMQAERSSRDTLETARQKAELKIQESESQAAEIIRRTLKDREGLQKEIGDLYRQREEVLTQLRVYLKTQLERLDTFIPSEFITEGSRKASPLHSQSEKPDFTPPPANGSYKPENTVFPKTEHLNGNGKAEKKTRTIFDDFSDEL